MNANMGRGYRDQLTADLSVYLATTTGGTLTHALTPEQLTVRCLTSGVAFSLPDAALVAGQVCSIHASAVASAVDHAIASSTYETLMTIADSITTTSGTALYYSNGYGWTLFGSTAIMG